MGYTLHIIYIEFYETNGISNRLVYALLINVYKHERIWIKCSKNVNILGGNVKSSK